MMLSFFINYKFIELRAVSAHGNALISKVLGWYEQYKLYFVLNQAKAHKQIYVFNLVSIKNPLPRTFTGFSSLCSSFVKVAGFYINLFPFPNQIIALIHALLRNADSAWQKLTSLQLPVKAFLCFGTESSPLDQRGVRGFTASNMPSPFIAKDRTIFSFSGNPRFWNILFTKVTLHKSILSWPQYKSTISGLNSRNITLAI